MNSVDIMERKATLKDEANSLIETARVEIRTLNETETNRINEIKQELANLNDELRNLESTVELPVETKTEIINNSNIRTQMNKSFSLLAAIRNIAENKQQDALSQSVIDKGAEEMRNAGINYVGQIQIPMSQEYRTVTVTTEHDDVVATDLMDVLEPLHAKSTLLQSGVKFLSNLKGDVQYPVMSAINASWESETATVSASNPTFSNVKLQPHRLSCVVPISKQFLIQDSCSAEQAIRNEIVNAINAKLEATILGNSNTAGQPQGLFYSASALTSITDFAGICTLEAGIENANMDGYSYICSPTAKAKLRNMLKGKTTTSGNATNINVGGTVYANGEIDGVKCLTTSNVANSNILCADFSQMVLAQFGNLDITVDNVTLAADGCIRLIVNSYWDFKVLRSGSYAVASIA